MAALLTIPLAAFLGLLTLDQLFVVALVNGVFSVFFDISYQAYLPLLIDRKDLIEGNQKLQLSASGATVAGPSIAGAVYQALTDVVSPKIVGAALTCAADAAGYLAASLALLDIRKPEPKSVPGLAGAEPSFFGEMKEGVHVVLGNPLLTRIAGCTATSNLGAYIVGPALLIFALQAPLTTRPLSGGCSGTMGALGFLVGALVAARVTARLGFGRGLAVSMSVAGLGRPLPPRHLRLPLRLPVRRGLHHRHELARLQHQPDQPETGDHPRPAPGPDERDDEGDRLGHDPGRIAPRWAPLPRCPPSGWSTPCTWAGSIAAPGGGLDRARPRDQAEEAACAHSRRARSNLP